ncbi:MAG: hypothetical protein ACYSWO_14170 [Planctomycetota bacterium]
MHRLLAILLAVLSVPLVTETAGLVPAFPGAEGFGARSLGGRGGEVLFVPSIDDSGPGIAA